MKPNRKFVFNAEQLLKVYNDPQLFASLISVWHSDPTVPTLSALITADALTKQYSLLFPDGKPDLTKYHINVDTGEFTLNEQPKQAAKPPKQPAQQHT